MHPTNQVKKPFFVIAFKHAQDQCNLTKLYLIFII